VLTAFGAHAAGFATARRCLRFLVACLKPHSITLSSCFEARSKLVADRFEACLRPALNQLA